MAQVMHPLQLCPTGFYPVSSSAKSPPRCEDKQQRRQETTSSVRHRPSFTADATTRPVVPPLPTPSMPVIKSIHRDFPTEPIDANLTTPKKKNTALRLRFANVSASGTTSKEAPIRLAPTRTISYPLQGSLVSSAQPFALPPPRPSRPLSPETTPQPSSSPESIALTARLEALEVRMAQLESSIRALTTTAQQQQQQQQQQQHHSSKPPLASKYHHPPLPLSSLDTTPTPTPAPEVDPTTPPPTPTLTYRPIPRTPSPLKHRLDARPTCSPTLSRLARANALATARTPRSALLADPDAMHQVAASVRALRSHVAALSASAASTYDVFGPLTGGSHFSDSEDDEDDSEDDSDDGKTNWGEQEVARAGARHASARLVDEARNPFECAFMAACAS